MSDEITHETDNPTRFRSRKDFPLLELPLLVLENIISFITDTFDLKAVRLCCKSTRDIIGRTPECLIHLKVVPKDLKDLESIVKNESNLKWNNFRFPPELYYVGCRRQYVQTFNNLFTDFAGQYAQHVEILEMDRFDWSNPCHANLLRMCKKLRVFKVDAMMLKGLSRQRITDLLEEEEIAFVLGNLANLDVIAFEFLQHDHQYEFMGKMLEKCTNLRQVGSWGYFPEWEQPVGGRTHLKYFVWPLLKFLRRRVPIVNLMLENVESYQDFVDREFQFLNEAMDWQAGKWVVDLRPEAESDYSGLEAFLYSRVKSYAHRAVGWFDESEFRKCGLARMKNLTTVHIHNARDINLTAEEDMPFSNPIFTKLENLTLIAGNRLSLDDALPLEKVVVDMLLNTRRPTVTTLKLDIDLDHHHEYGSISLPVVIQNFPSLTSFCVEEWGPRDEQLLAIYEAFPNLQVLMFCGRNISDLGILGRGGDGDDNETEDVTVRKGICKLSSLQILKIFSVRLPPKNVFPWPIKDNNRITDLSFLKGFSKLPLRKFHLLLKSETITDVGIKALLEGAFSASSVEFLMNWLPTGFENVECFQQLSKTFKFLDPQTFLEPANFCIPDIGKWVL